ncbi:unnamed protein product [Peniophora sp. CBMAI 1063]|nr:unnamed protein product [Peniophora sp. CBMAI 1063]
MASQQSDSAVKLQYYLVLAHLEQVLGGLYLWGFVTHIGFDWDIITRPASAKTSWYGRGAYLAARYLLLAAFVDIYFGIDNQRPTVCLVENLFELALPALAAQSATALIVTRVIAIWDRKLLAVVLSIMGLLTQLCFVIYSLANVDTGWDPIQKSCSIQSAEDTGRVTVVFLTVDVFLLGLMVVGLRRWKNAGQAQFSLWHVLWTQGWVWLVIVTLCGVPPVVLLYLNVNQVMNLLLLTPQLVAIVIGATRLYRSLASFSRGESEDSAVTSCGSGGS